MVAMDTAAQTLRRASNHCRHGLRHDARASSVLSTPRISSRPNTSLIGVRRDAYRFKIRALGRGRDATREGILPRRQFGEPRTPALDGLETGQGDLPLFRIWQGDADGEVGDRQLIAQEIQPIAQMVIENPCELLEGGRSLLDRLGVGRFAQQTRPDQVLEIKHAGMPREMLAVPTQPAHKVDLARRVAGPKLRSGGLSEVAHDRVRLPQAQSAIAERGDLPVRVDCEKLWRLLLALAEVDAHELDWRVEVARDRAGFAGVKCLEIIKLHCNCPFPGVGVICHEGIEEVRVTSVTGFRW